MNMIRIYTGKEILALREALEMSPTEFAAKLGVSASAVCRWEQENRLPKIKTMIEINKLAEKASKKAVAV